MQKRQAALPGRLDQAVQGLPLCAVKVLEISADGNSPRGDFQSRA